MSWLTVAWSMCAAACGMLALLNLFLWLKQCRNAEPMRPEGNRGFFQFNLVAPFVLGILQQWATGRWGLGSK